MTSPLDTMRQKIKETTPEETPDGLVRVIYDGHRKGSMRLTVDTDSGRAIASNSEGRQVVVHPDPAIAAIRAISSLITGGVTR